MPKRIDENELAKRATLLEGKKRSLPIAQIKETAKILFRELSAEWHGGNEAGVIELLKRHRYRCSSSR